MPITCIALSALLIHSRRSLPSLKSPGNMDVDEKSLDMSFEEIEEGST